MDRSRTQSRRPLIKCTVSVTAIWRAYRAILGNSLSRLNLRYQTTVSVPHNIDAAFFPKPTHSPYQPETPSKMGVPAYQPETPSKKGVPLSRAPIEKETSVEKETLDAELSNNPPYMLGRDYQASARLALLHCLNHASNGFLLHPSIPLANRENLRVADVGCGTGLWLASLAREMPASARLDGFDISDQQFPRENIYGDNVSLSTLDIFKPLPRHVLAKYDVVHIRYFMGIAVNDSVQIAMDNLNAMLKPGGYLQWDEEDSLSKMPVFASKTDAAQAQLRWYIRNRLWPNTEWINNIPAHFQQSGLHVIHHSSHPPLPLYRKPWTEDFLLAYAEVANSLENENERLWFQDMHARTVRDAANGWNLDWELIICVGRKAVVAA
ncbi:hypothetical protein JMJ35_007904 [Cladonia borealis]|uniref:Methyltransferase domain-containing protein n=1 Tax=Cladonia borealis TaxID=184061 RepID=A0AA39QWS1_9LECA|nr:hypothetical protein JMJ35_007904 [Cladonia borealis]